MIEITFGIETEPRLLDWEDRFAEFEANSTPNESLLRLYADITVGKQVRQQKSPESERAAPHL